MSHALSLTLFGLVTGDHLSRSGTQSWAVKLALLAAVCGLWALRSCGSHAPCGRVPVMLLVERSLLVRFRYSVIEKIIMVMLIGVHTKHRGGEGGGCS
ncbi:hypothetical protein Tco_0986441 [Tanacetum coccineum]